MDDLGEPLDAGHIYTGPHFHKEGWKPAAGKCRAACSETSGNSTHFWQCTRPAKVEREVFYHGKPATFGYCGQHDPVKVKERKGKRQAKWNAKYAEKARMAKERERKRELREAALAAIRLIADGHNDARGLAQEVLARYTPTNEFITLPRMEME